jgi:high-affinity K+ transport system ATPase subunit B
MRKNNKGFFRIFILLIVVIIFLSLLNVDFKKASESPVFKNNLDFLWGIGSYVWHNFILYPIDVILNKIISVIPKR